MGMGGCNIEGGALYAPVGLGRTKGKPSPFSASQSPASLATHEYVRIPAFISHEILCSEAQNEELSGFPLALMEHAAGATCNLWSPPAPSLLPLGLMCSVQLMARKVKSWVKDTWIHSTGSGVEG